MRSMTISLLGVFVLVPGSKILDTRLYTVS